MPCSDNIDSSDSTVASSLLSRLRRRLRRTAPSLLRCFRLLPSSLPRVEGRESAVDARLPRGGSSAASRSAKLTRLGGRLDVPGRLPWPVGGRLPRGVLWPVCGRLPVGGRLPEARRSASIVCTATSRYELQAAPLSVRRPALG